MLADVIRNLERTENLRRDSELTTSTVETFVSERPVFTLNIPEAVDKDKRVGDVERKPRNCNKTKDAVSTSITLTQEPSSYLVTTISLEINRNLNS